MAKEGLNGVFGKPRAKLAKASSRLEEDAQVMEARLLQLRVTMQEERQKRDAELPLKHAGNRWRSAREDRGSVRQYARDVQQKKLSKKESSDRSASGSTKGSKPKKSLSKAKLMILSPATVEQWAIPQVLEWLTTIGLEEFQSGFEFHQVSGKMLLEMTPEGCEKLGVYKLSARNRLLAEMEQIRALHTKKHLGDGRVSAEAAEIIDPKLRDVELVPELPSPPSKLAAKTHWSHVAPISENDISSDGQVPVNLADGAFDEEASHATFMKALLEWRESDSKQSAAKSNQDEEWINPMLSGDTTEERDGEKDGGALLEGTYDEEEARDSFQQALLAWRNGADSKRSTAPAPIPVEQTESGCVPGERKSCWQCYRVERVDALVHDEQTNKSFCGSTCQEAYHEQYARFYPSSS